MDKASGPSFFCGLQCEIPRDFIAKLLLQLLFLSDPGGKICSRLAVSCWVLYQWYSISGTLSVVLY